MQHALAVTRSRTGARRDDDLGVPPVAKQKRSKGKRRASTPAKSSRQRTRKPARRAATVTPVAASGNGAREPGPDPRVARMRAQLDHLKQQLTEAQETLDAIRNGEVDALVVAGPNGNRVYSLEGADQPYRVYVEQMQEGAVTVAAASATVLYANRRFAEMLGLPLERVIGSRLTAHVAEDDRELLAATLTLHRPAKAECTLLPKGRGALPVQFTASPLPLPQPQPALSPAVYAAAGAAPERITCLVVTDLSEQKEAAALRVAKEAAEATSLAKDNFLAALSHELRTPLNPALMAAEQLERETDLPARLRDDAAMIRRNIELEARLIDDLLDLTRIARGKLELHARAVDVHAELRNAIEICRADLAARGLTLATDLAARRHTVVADPVRLQQAFWNLIRNAVKFTPQGGRVNVRTLDGPDPFLRVEVQDNGIGISPDAMHRLFRPFEQADRSITRQYGGLGLGLAITKAIIDQHAGRLSAASAGAGQGATFVVELQTLSPRAAGATRHTAADADGAPRPAAQPLPTASRTLSILLVEDHDDTRKSMSMLLRRRFRHEVCAVGNAGDALKAAGQRPFDLVISDLGLPDKSGLDLMRDLRDRHRLRGICLSGYGMEDDLARSKAAGFDYHLIKPINLERLETLIREIANPETAKI